MAKESFFSKAKADGQVFFKTVNLMTQLSKLKLAVRAKRQEREKLMRTIGATIFDIYHGARKLDSDVISNAVLGDLRTIEDLEAQIKDLEQEAEQVKSDFRSSHEKKSEIQDQPPQS
jgi:hypothetical protein